MEIETIEFWDTVTINVNIHNSTFITICILNYEVTIYIWYLCKTVFTLKLPLTLFKKDTVLLQGKRFEKHFVWKKYNRRRKNSVLFWSFFPCFITIFKCCWVWYTEKHGTTHKDTSHWAHSYSHSGCFRFHPVAMSIDLSAGTHTLHEQLTRFLRVPSIFMGQWQPVRLWSCKPEVDGLPEKGWERSRAADLIVCFITSVQKLLWESFFFPLSATHSEYVI